MLKIIGMVAVGWFVLSVLFVAFVWQPMLGRWYRTARYRPVIKHPEDNPNAL
jgi:hypothetical protein